MPSEAYYAFVKAAENYLRKSKSISSDRSKSNVQIVNSIGDLIEKGKLDISIAEGTMLNYLSRAANDDPGSQIRSGGPRGGYWLDENAESDSQVKPLDEETIESGENENIKIIEKDLYPLMELWLQGKGYTSKDVSGVRRGGKWGNPDIIGVERIELFGAVQIELASCEVKLSEKDWEQVIFEAISHKRFANRSWFCYRTSNPGEALISGMEYYAERYRVGIVQIVLSDSELIQLKNGEKAPLELINSVREIIPAQYDSVPLVEQSDLIQRTGVTLTLAF